MYIQNNLRQKKGKQYLPAIMKNQAINGTNGLAKEPILRPLRKGLSVETKTRT